MSEQPICELWLQIIERLADRFGRPIPKRLLELGNCDEGWRVRFNATSKQIDEIEPLAICVEWCGWPAGIIDAGGGVIAAGDAANQDTLIEWLTNEATIVV